MPTLAPSSRRTPATSKCAAMARRTAAATATPAAGVSTERRRIANSSPPRRATVSSSPQQARQALADLAQHLVAVVVAERVVDLLEAVEVEQHHGHAGAGAPGDRGWRAGCACGRGRGWAARSARRAGRGARRSAPGGPRAGRRPSAAPGAAGASAPSRARARRAGPGPSRMPSVVDWRMSSEEIWSRRRVPVVSAMAPATRPVLTTKKTRGGREDGGHVGGA